VKKFTIKTTINNMNCVDLSLKKKKIKKNITTSTVYLNITGKKLADLICGVDIVPVAVLLLLILLII
jgi:hypothetical protein